MKLHKSNLIFFEVNHILLFSKKNTPAVPSDAIMENLKMP